MRDITKRKKAEKRLKLHRKRYETIFNSVPVGIIIEDKKGNILEVNRDMCVMSGYTKKELEKSNVIDKFVLPKYKDLACENIKKLINGTDLEHDIKTLKKNGEMRYYYLKETNIELPSEEKGIISMHIDVTERVKQREKLELMSFTVNNSKLLVFRASPKGIIEYINKTVLDKLGYKKEELIGENAKMLLRDENYIKREKFWNQIKNNTSITYERSYVTKDGNLLPVQITSQYFKYEDKEYEFVFAQDITERKRKEREIKYLSYRDPLTDLYNRRFFEKEVNKFDNKKDIQVSIIMADINGLKLINDTYGHEKGDKLLVEAAQLLKRFIREDDILARHGGDEFVIFLPDTSYEHAHKIINRIKNRKKENTKKEIPLSITMGVATRKDNKEKLKDTLKRADNRMYKNKLSESRSAKHRVVENLINTLAAKSSETKEHAVRMTKLAYDLGNKIGLSNSELNKLSLLATLHDIGKTTIAEDILTKPDKLSAEEWEIIKTHTERGYKIVSASEEFSSVAKEVLYHHEKWDGSGYPEGLKGEEIPYLSRMISIIDAYDVMTNDRTYSPAMSVIEALEEIKSCSGSQFDPELAEGFVTLKENGK